MRKRPTAPRELEKAGRKLWGAIFADAPENVVLDARERSILGTACAQADQNVELEEALKRDGVTIRGASGQWRLNAAATELRQGRLALAKLLEQVCLDRVRAPEVEDDFLPDWLREET